MASSALLRSGVNCAHGKWAKGRSGRFCCKDSPRCDASARWEAPPGPVAGPGDQPGREPVIAPNIELEDFGPTDLYQYLLTNRIIFIHSPINEDVANNALASMMAMEMQDPEEDIKVYLHSRGAINHCVIGLMDTIKSLKCDVSTVAFGYTGGNVTLLLSAGTPGKRYAMPSTRIALGQPMAGAAGSSYDVNLQVKEQNRNLKAIVEFYQSFTGMERQRIEEELDREHYVSPHEAKDMGLIDHVLN